MGPWPPTNHGGGFLPSSRRPGPRCEYGFGQNVNDFHDRDGLRGLYLHSNKWPEDHPRFGSMALLTPNRRTRGSLARA